MDYPSPYTGGPAASPDAPGSGVVLAVIIIASVISYVLYAVLLGMIFKKVGVKVWKAWIPVYNQWTFLELGGQKGWLSLLSLVTFLIIPFVVLYVYSAIAADRIARSFGKDSTFVLLYIFLPLVWMVWLAVDKTAIWHGSADDLTIPSPTPTPQPVE